MEDFDVPTVENRLIVHEDQLFQLAVDWARESRPVRGSKVPRLSHDEQRELKRIIAVMLVQDEDRDVVEGELLRVTLRKFDGGVVADTFEFTRKRRKLHASPFVYRFSVARIA